MTENFQLLPVNKDSFQELLPFGKIILNICLELKITPVVYGSLAYFYHTHDENMPVNDLDLLVPEKAFPELIKMLAKNHIQYEEMPWTSIVCKMTHAKVELDSIERNLASRIRKVHNINIGDLQLGILNLKSLTSIYQEAVDRMPDTEEFKKQKGLYAKKLNNLKKYTLNLK